jgi:hypothetical protein
MEEKTLMDRMEEYCMRDAEKCFSELIEHTTSEAKRRLYFNYSDAQIMRLIEDISTAIEKHREVFVPRFYARCADCFFKDVKRLSEFFEKRLEQEAQDEK